MRSSHDQLLLFACEEVRLIHQSNTTDNFLSSNGSYPSPQKRYLRIPPSYIFRSQQQYIPVSQSMLLSNGRRHSIILPDCRDNRNTSPCKNLCVHVQDNHNNHQTSIVLDKSYLIRESNLSVNNRNQIHHNHEHLLQKKPNMSCAWIESKVFHCPNVCPQ